MAALAFPNRQRAPAGFLQRSHLQAISLFVPADLRKPVFTIGFRNAGAPPAIMAMPKTSMDENHFPSAYQHNVGRTGQIFAMQSKPVSEPVQFAANDEFRLGIFRAHRPHDAAAELFTLCRHH